MGQTKITPWVKGNTLPIAVSLKTKTSVNGKWIMEDYTPPAGSEIHAYIVGSVDRYEYLYTLDGNIVRFTDNGHLKVGTYGVEITVKEPTDYNRRTFKCQQIRVFNCTDEIGMLPDGEVVLDAAVFIQGQKGDKGDPLTYQDLTQEQIAELQRPATEAAGEVAELERTISGHEETRETNEQNRQRQEGTRQENELERGRTFSQMESDFGDLKRESQSATSAANNAAGHANEKAEYAEQKGGYAKDQGDYAKRKAEEIEDAKGSYQTLDDRLDAMDAETGAKMDAPTEEEFNGIFN